MALCHGQLYQHRIKNAFDKKVRPRPYVVNRAFFGGALILADSKGQELKHPVNADVIKLFYP
ncbi:hypothetical protein CR513_11740, partial [Mucuna pruriens]